MTGATELFFVFLTVGILLICVEIFIPGGVVGVLGSIALAGAVVTGFFAFGTHGGLLASATMVVIGGIAIVAWLKFVPRTTMGRKITLSADLSKAKSTQDDLAGLVGQTGIARSDLRPSGVAEIGGQRIDVIAESGYISQGTKVQVTQVDGIRIAVRGAKS